MKYKNQKKCCKIGWVEKRCFKTLKIKKRFEEQKIKS